VLKDEHEDNAEARRQADLAGKPWYLQKTIGSAIQAAGRQHAAAEKAADAEFFAPSAADGVAERMSTLRDLHQRGILDDDEFAAKRAEILGSL